MFLVYVTDQCYTNKFLWWHIQRRSTLKEKSFGGKKEVLIIRGFYCIRRYPVTLQDGVTMLGPLPLYLPITGWWRHSGVRSGSSIS